MKQISIGLHACECPEHLRATLENIRFFTRTEYDLLLLPDGPDAATSAFIATLGGIPQSATAEPRGAAACFNRLLSGPKSDMYVFLESGTLVASNWLKHLLAALDSDPCNGLAGPSTNLAWNEQCVFRQGGHTAAEIEHTARQAFTQFGYQVRTLEPLYSLADFCYVVRREVVDAIGFADEGYGLGPCWEMDYNIRAARAGWRGVWACAAYVYRFPFTARRRRDEAMYFEAGKRRYQDKFCGARLRGEKSDYRLHCRGDACPNFAPRELIAIRQPLTGISIAAPTGTPLATTRELRRSEPTIEVSAQHDPLVSCIMPTYNRRSFVPQSIRCFLRQDYTNTELVIVDDGSDAIVDCVPEDARIRYIRLDRKLTIGAKRNLACAQARGEIIVHWDDDDWYPSQRVRSQARALLDRGIDVCGSSIMLFFDAASDQAFEYKYAAPGPAWVAGSTLAYRKGFWEHNNFPDIQVGEDSRFVWSHASKIVCDLADATLCVAMIHPGNTSPKQKSGVFWNSQPRERIRELLGDELNFYRAMVKVPLVSCIMPTCNRRSFVRLALKRFLHQDYANKELVIVDDGDDAVGDLGSGVSAFRYVRLPVRTSIGAKRNLACEEARGEIIAHWDDDDWYAPDRLRYQVAPILAEEADITGLENAFVLELPGGTFWTTSSQLHQQMFFGNVHGGTLVFRKQLLSEGLSYPEINLAEDAWLLNQAVRRGKQLLRLSNPGVYVYLRHGRNAWREFIPGHFLNPAGWRRIAPPPMFSASVLASYQAASATI